MDWSAWMAEGGRGLSPREEALFRGENSADLGCYVRMRLDLDEQLAIAGGDPRAAAESSYFDSSPATVQAKVTEVTRCIVEYMDDLRLDQVQLLRRLRERYRRDLGHA